MRSKWGPGMCPLDQTPTTVRKAPCTDPDGCMHACGKFGSKISSMLSKALWSMTPESPHWLASHVRNEWGGMTSAESATLHSSLELPFSHQNGAPLCELAHSVRLSSPFWESNPSMRSTQLMNCGRLPYQTPRTASSNNIGSFFPSCTAQLRILKMHNGPQTKPRIPC